MQDIIQISTHNQPDFEHLHDSATLELCECHNYPKEEARQMNAGKYGRRHFSYLHDFLTSPTCLAQFRYGFVPTETGYDLIAWIRTEVIEPANIFISR